ncbi:unnamed protein product, partial [Rotaria magnacalcarata]
KFSVQTVLNGSFPRVGDKQQQQQQQQQHTQQLTNGNRSVKSYNILNNDSSLPFLNDSVG